MKYSYSRSWRTAQIIYMILGFIILLLGILSLCGKILITQEPSITLIALGIAVISLGITWLNPSQDETKTNEILTKLNDIQEKLDNVRKDNELSPLAEGLVSIIKCVDHVTKQKRERT